MSDKLRYKAFIKKSQEKFGDRFEYYELNFPKNDKTKAVLGKCNLHQIDIETTISNHFAGDSGGCKDCRYHRPKAGTTTRLCVLCNEQRPLDKFEKTRNTCKACRGRKKRKEMIKNNKKSPRDELIYNKKVEDGMKCNICGIKTEILLTFDHIDPEIHKMRTNISKKNNINPELGEFKMIRGLPNKLEDCKIELEKPHQWLCHNCHRKKTNLEKKSTTICLGKVYDNKFKDNHGGNCKICGETNKEVLQWDHVFEDKKNFTLSTEFQKIRIRKNGQTSDSKTNEIINKIKTEINESPCDLLCCNCNYLKEVYRLKTQNKESDELIDTNSWFFKEEDGKEFVIKLNKYIQSHI
jgi:hypothetical protein